MSRTSQGVRKTIRSLSALFAVLAIACMVAAYPKPAPVPYRWGLEFQSGDLRLYIDPASKEGYWFFTYTVTNRTGKDQLWAPSMVLYTDAGEILQSGHEVPTKITKDL